MSKVKARIVQLHFSPLELLLNVCISLRLNLRTTNILRRLFPTIKIKTCCIGTLFRIDLIRHRSFSYLLVKNTVAIYDNMFKKIYACYAHNTNNN